jgi:hypothetical protein
MAKRKRRTWIWVIRRVNEWNDDVYFFRFTSVPKRVVFFNCYHVCCHQGFRVVTGINLEPNVFVKIDFAGIKVIGTEED